MNKHKLTYANILTIILCVFLSIIPWVSHLKFWELSEAMSTIFPNEKGIYIDMFLYYKEIMVIGMGVLLLCALAGEYIFLHKTGKNIPLMTRDNHWILKCVIIYIAAVVLSAVFSKDGNTTIMGIPSEGEGVFALISYMLLFLGVINYLREERDWNVFRYALELLMFLTILLSCVEFFYKPLFEIPFFQNMLAGAEYKAVLENIENTSFRNFVVLTFFNPNYFGGFCLLLIPFAAKELMGSQSIWQRIGYGARLAALYFCVITAKSSTSFYLAILEGIVLLGITWFCDREERKRLLINIGVFALSFIVIFGTAYLINGTKLEQVSISAMKNQRWQELETAQYRLSDIKIEDNRLIFYMDGKSLTVTANKGALEFYDEDGKQLPIKVKSNTSFELDDEKFSGITVQANGNELAFDFGYENLAYFWVAGNEFYGFGQNGQMIKNVSLGNMEERFGAEVYGWITGRGYAWVNTLPLLKDTWLLGKGAGNFPLHFPQHDYVGLLNTHGNHKLVADKPHSMYLQIAVDQGVIALAAMLVLFAGTAIGYIKIRFRYTKKDWKPGMADAAFTVLLAFMLYSSCNDSTIAVSPVFWMIFGSLVAVLLIMKKENGHQ